MKEIRSLLLSTLLLYFTLFFFTGCEDKKAQKPLIAVENTTEVLTQKDENQEEQEEMGVEVEEVTVEIIETKKEPIGKEFSEAQMPTDTFTLNDIQQNKHSLIMNNQKMIFHNIDQSIVIVNFFTTWYSPCRGEIPYLSDLQKKYEKKVFVAGILVNDKQSDDTLKHFMNKYHANYFISNSKHNDAFASKVAKELQLPENFPIPLTVIYKDGDYYTHYEGAVPIEMIDHDIQEIIK